MTSLKSTFSQFFTVDLKELRKIVELMNEHGLTYFDMSREDFHLKLKKGPDLDTLKGLLSAMPATAAVPLAAPLAAQPSAAPSAAEPNVTPISDDEEITSPMVGTFYDKPSPEASPFVKVGDVVNEGQTLCIIEAMKVMNEIKSETSGTITATPCEDGMPVQFGDVLFRVK